MLFFDEGVRNLSADLVLFAIVIIAVELWKSN